MEPGTDRLIGTRYGCLRCRVAFSVIGGRAAMMGDRAQDIIRHIERGNGDMAKKEIPIQRDADMPWGR